MIKVMKKRIVAAAALSLAAVILLSSCGTQGTNNGESKVNTAGIQYGDLILGLGSDGKVALPVTNLNFEIEGIVKKIYVNVGDHVKAGDLLAELDDSDYQFAISGAANSLNKAQAAYDSAVGQYEYDVQRVDNELSSLQASIDAGFDSYSYQVAVDDARTALDRKRAELAAAEAKVNDPFDPYTYDNSIADAEQALEARRKELDEARAAIAAGFDDYSYQNSIQDAQQSVDRRKKDYDIARNAGDVTSIDSLYESYADALRDLDRAKLELERALEQHDKNVRSQYETALSNFESAEAALSKAKTDRARAQSQSIGDAGDQLAAARLAVTDAESALQKAYTNLTRAREEYDEQLQSTIESYDLAAINENMTKNANSSISNAAFALEEAKLNLEEARQNLEKAKIYAPRDGQIINVTLGEGERVSAQAALPGMFLGTANSLNSFMTLCDPTEIYLTASITEGDIVGVSVDQDIRVEIDAIGGEVFYGKVTIVSSIPSTDVNGITTYSVTCRLDDTSDVIRDGMNSYIVFVKRELRNVLLVPNKAVFIEDGMQYVNVVKSDGGYEKRKVLCGLSNGVQSELVEGLDAGETVVVGKLG